MYDYNPISIKICGLISPLGFSLTDAVKRLENGISGLSRSDRIKGFEDFYLGHINEIPIEGKFDYLLELGLTDIEKENKHLCLSDDTIMILSTSKADISSLPVNPFKYLQDKVQKRLRLSHKPLIISNACISGVLAINVGADLIKSGKYKHAIIVGIDVLSEFVIGGFNSLFALTNDICQPYDRDRKGINLGEAIGSVVLSSEEKYSAVYLGGATNNDANHISGPSRTGEGLYRAVRNCLNHTGVLAEQIDYISAHGTSSVYSDEMESIAFDRLGLTHPLINSFKGYVGHSLGASGLVETILGLLSIKHGFVAKSLGYENHGVSRKINVSTKFQEKDIRFFLKTASGFGGCNSALLIDCK